MSNETTPVAAGRRFDAAVDDVMPGKRLGRKAVRVELGFVTDFLGATEGNFRHYAGQDGSAPTLIPMGLLSAEPWGWPGAYVDYWRDGVASSMEWAAYDLAHAGQEVDVEATVIDRYVRRAREASVVEVLITGELGRLIWRGSGTYSAKIDPDLVRPDVERRAETAPAAQTGAVERLELGKVVFTLAMSRQFWAYRSDLGDGNFHVDTAAARAMGLPDVMIGSSHLVAWCCERLTDAHGRQWLKSGAIAVTFRAPVFAGDSITMRVWPLSNPDRTSFGLELVNQRNATVLSGTASIAG